MAFSLRKMFSNITYFKKSENPEHSKIRRDTYVVDEPFVIHYEATEPDSTSRQCTSLNLPDTVKNFAAKKGSLSDTDLLKSTENPIRKRKSKKLKVNIEKATSHSMNTLSYDSNVENTPKHVHLECKSSDAFSEKFRSLDFNKSFHLIDAMSDDPSSSPFEEEFEIESLSGHSDSDISVLSNKSSIKMCRKITESQSSDDKHIAPSVSIESFSDIELDKNEEERVRLLVDYETKLEKLELFMKKLLSEFQFHIEVSKVFNSRSACIPGKAENIPQMLHEFMYNSTNKPSLSDSWNVILEKEDNVTKYKVKKHLLSMKQFIDEFVRLNLQNSENSDADSKQSRPVKKCKRYVPKHVRISHKKKMKHFDFPDLREAMLNLFNENVTPHDSTTDISSSDESDMSKCTCKCHSTSSETESESSPSTNDQSTSITSSIGNFTLDMSELTAYSESLDRIVSYNSFQDTSLYNTLLQKAAIERISFYVQVHSIQLKSEEVNQDGDMKSTLTFHCPSCKDVQTEENGLLRHILSPLHCEKIHFLYKTAYIKKCVAAGKEIQPSTVLNPMTMYRDDNKIVCFGDALYACTLCFENLIVGEYVLMKHCCEPQHIERKEKLADIIG
ncbi:uncharacterized protein LOC123879489 [Maniola jurtina]|uniref:uncharacterized protein LOC123879489 n=1 Tax=Maniola jurtina TaxID=191418 RepID=UPI001E68DD7E|nr:uncharacterized protein LOC123879489 [Maniola jurtina]